MNSTSPCHTWVFPILSTLYFIFLPLYQLSAMSTVSGRHQVWGHMLELLVTEAPGICPHPSFLFVDRMQKLELGRLNSFPAEVNRRENECPSSLTGSPVHSFTQRSHYMPSTGQRWRKRIVLSFRRGSPSLMDSRNKRRGPRKHPLVKWQLRLHGRGQAMAEYLGPLFFEVLGTKLRDIT